MLTAKNGKKVNFFKNNPKWGNKGKLKENQSLFGQNGKFFKKKICFNFSFVQKNPKICARKEISFKQK